MLLVVNAKVLQVNNSQVLNVNGAIWLQGFEVSGSDIVWSSYMDGLQEAGAHLNIGHSVSSLKGIKGSRLPDAMVVSSAIPQDNVEILHANAAGVPV